MRPLNSLEKSTGGETCIEFDDNKILCKVNESSFKFYINICIKFKYFYVFLKGLWDR